MVRTECIIEAINGEETRVCESGKKVWHEQGNDS